MSLFLVVALGCSKKESAPKPADNAPTQPVQPATTTTVAAAPPTTAPPSRPPPPPLSSDDVVPRRLFADDVPTDKLALSLGIETKGGGSRIIIPRNAPLPATHTEVFTTAADNQTSLDVHVVQGERPMAADNRNLGVFQLVNIPPGPAGVPQVEVTFAIDDKGVITVSALDLTTNTNKRLEIEGGLLGSRFDKSDVAKALAAEAVATQAQESAEAWVFGRAKLEELTVATMRAVDDNAAYMSQDIQRETTQAVKKARAFLDANPNKVNGDVAAVQAATRDLMKATTAAQAELARSGK